METKMEATYSGVGSGPLQDLGRLGNEGMEKEMGITISITRMIQGLLVVSIFAIVLETVM